MRPRRKLRITWGYLAALVVAASLLVPVNLCAKTPPPKPKAAPPSSLIQTQESSARPKAPEAVSLAEVATQAIVVESYLDTLKQLTAGSIETQAIQNQFHDLSTQSESDAVEATRIIKEQPTLEKLQSLQQRWQGRQQKLNAWLAILTLRATKIQDELNHLDVLQKNWTLTSVTAISSKAPPLTVQQIAAILASIRTAQISLVAVRATVLDIQDLVVKELNRVGTELAAVTSMQQQVVGGLLVRNAPQLWSAELRDQARLELVPHVKLFGNFYLLQLHQFLVERPWGLFLLCGIFLLLALLILAMRRRVLLWEATGDQASAIAVFERPYAAALLVTLLTGSSHLFPVPQTLRTSMMVMSIFPMIRLTQPVVAPHLLSPLYTLGVLFALDTIRQGVAGAPMLEQVLLLVESVAGIIVLWLFVAPVFGARQLHGKETSLVMRIQWGTALAVMVILAVSMGAVTFGYLRLARLLVSGVLVGGTLALSQFTFIRVLSGIVAFGLRVWPLNCLRMVSNHRKLLERRVFLGLVVIGIGGWVLRTLGYIGLQTAVVTFVTTVLTARLQRQSFSVSLGDVIAFGMSLWLAFLLSSFICFILNEDVFPRMKTTLGVSYAVTSLLRYLLVIIGFLAGLGELGVSLSRVIILVSAFGVGMGFGLQNVVNNIVSGLLLLFERPIHIGDTVEFGAVLGNVKEIGLRASKVRSWRGADIIVPNSQLVSDSVTNWTYSDQMRRIDLPVGVNYGADPRTVIGILESVALANSRIVKNPAPQGLMMEYGDSTINFELRAWTGDFQVWPQVRSDLAVAIYDAVRDAGMSFPFPQRDVHLIRDLEPVKPG